ncbi:MAG: hypothetical protein E7173_01725 [Firmicutes bacterium]|nr:hypothetical protein [Bacillota bacterium]
MRGFGNALKRFFMNKNTITILGVIVIVGLLYFGYTSQINTQVKPVRVPVAAQEIQPRTLITENMIEYVEMPAAAVTKKVVTASRLIVGKYANYNTVIPEGSMFFSNVLVTADEMPDSAFVDIKEGDIPYQFSVNMETTYGNSIVPGNKVDIYMKAIDDSGKVMVGKLLENVEVLSVKDANGRHVFENTTENRTPAYFIFGVNNEIHLLLRKAEYLYSYAVELFPVPHGGTVEAVGETKVSTQYLKDFINANTVNLPNEIDNNITPGA